MASSQSHGYRLQRSILYPFSTGNPEGSTTVANRKTPKDLVTFLEALSSVLQGEEWLEFTFVNAIEASPEFTRSATFSIRRYRLQRRIHTPRRRYVPGEIVILKVPRAHFREGVTVEEVTSEQVDALIREIQIMAHPPIQANENIIDLLQLLWEFDKNILRPVLLIEYAEHGTLKDFLQSDFSLTIEVKKECCLEIASGLESLHQCGILHGDLKCENILIVTSKSGNLVAKITDFGFSKLLTEVEVGGTMIVGGTFPFTAPETSKPVPREMLLFTDCYSYGMLVWQLFASGSDDLFTTMPFPGPSQGQNDEDYVASSKGRSDFIENVKTSLRLHALSNCDEDDLLPIDHLFENTLSLDPATRSLKRALEILRPAPVGSNENKSEVEDEHSSSQNLRKLPDAAIINLSQFHDAPQSVKAQVVKSLTQIVNDSSETSCKSSRKAQACYLLSQCYFNSFGVTYGKDSEGLSWLVRAADLGHVEAQAIALHMHRSLGVEFPADKKHVLLQWLASGVETGSHVAAQDLLSLNDADSRRAYDSAAGKLRDQYYGIGVDLFSDLREDFSLDQATKICELHAMSSGKPTVFNDRGDSLLHWAAMRGRQDIIEILLVDYSSHYNINDVNYHGESALLQACRSGQLKTALNLVEDRGADVEVSSCTGETSLHWIISFSDDEYERAGVLLYTTRTISSYALRNSTTYEHAGLPYIPGTPLHRAVAAQRHEVVRFLLDMGNEKGAVAGADGFSPGLIWFDKAKSEEINDVLNDELSRDDQSTALSFLPIHWACKAHDSRMIEILLEKGFKTPDWPEMTDLRWDPSIYEDVDLKLMDIPQFYRKDKPSDKMQKIMENIYQRPDGLGDVLYSSRSLLSYASDPFPRFLRLILHSNKVQIELKDTIGHILQLPGQKVDRVDWVGKTAFLVACFNNDTETIQHLLSRQDLEEPMLEQSWQGGWGVKPLHIAVRHGNLLCLQALLESGADPMGRSSAGLTPMHVCASSYLRDLSIARELVARAPALIHESDQNEPPFSTAVRNHDFEMADYLLEQGADPNRLLGPHKSNTVLLQVILAANVEDLEALRYLLRIPAIDFLVAPGAKMTALHAAGLARMFHDQNDEFDDAYERQDLFRAVLDRFNSYEYFMYRDKRGMIPLHVAVMARNTGAVELLLPAMIAAAANINELSDFWGMPVGSTPLDCAFLREMVPPEVQKWGRRVITRYESKTATLHRLIESYGGKGRKEVVQQLWSSLTWTQRQAARFLSNEMLTPLSNLAQNLDGLRLMGPDVKTTRERIAAERNPDEIKYDLSG